MLGSEHTSAKSEDIPEVSRYILIVEDHVPTAEMLCELLQEEGYAADWTNNAGTALGMISGCDRSGGATRCPDLILLDLTMQGLNPIDMVRTLPQVLQPAPAVIVLSARPISEVQSAANSINAAGIVHKPFQIDTLLDLVEQALASTVT